MDVDEAVALVVREEWGRLVALLLAQFRRLDLVEDALADAAEAAIRTWGRDGVPERPAAWLLTAARRKLTDQLRAEAVALRKQALLVTEATRKQQGARVMADPGTIVEDDVLRLVLMCTHPALTKDSASALSLRLVMGVPTRDIARLYLVPEATMAARLTRTKRRIVSAGIPFAVPSVDVLPQRLDSVAQTAYLAFTAGYSPGSGPDLLRADLADEAVRLGRTVLGIKPDEPVLIALLALMLLQHSRRDARVIDGRLVLLADQDRSRWHWHEIEQARELLSSPQLSRPMTTTAAAYALQAQIAAEHAAGASAAETRWQRIVTLYDSLITVAPSPSARLARVVAVAQHSGAEAGLAALCGFAVPGSHRPDVVRAELLAQTGDFVAARAAYDQAIAGCANDVERAHLTSRRDLAH